MGRPAKRALEKLIPLSSGSSGMNLVGLLHHNPAARPEKGRKRAVSRPATACVSRRHHPPAAGTADYLTDNGRKLFQSRSCRLMAIYDHHPGGSTRRRTLTRSRGPGHGAEDRAYRADWAATWLSFTPRWKSPGRPATMRKGGRPRLYEPGCERGQDISRRRWARRRRPGSVTQKERSMRGAAGTPGILTWERLVMTGTAISILPVSSGPERPHSPDGQAALE